MFQIIYYLNFYIISREFTKQEGRELLALCLNEFMHQIQLSEEIQPYMSEDFSEEDLEISISHLKPKEDCPNYSYLKSISQRV